MEQRFHAIAVRSAWGSASTDSGAAKADCRRSSYSTPYCPPQALQHLRHQQRELALLDEITVPTPVYEAMTLFDGDGPIDPTVRRPMFIDSSCTCIPRKCKSTTLIPGPEATKEQK